MEIEMYLVLDQKTGILTSAVSEYLNKLRYGLLHKPALAENFYIL
jgi:hypothetical protein